MNKKLALKRVLTLLQWITLFFFGLFCLIFSIPAFFYNLIRLFWKKQIGTGLDNLSSELKVVDITIDVLGNVTLFNWIDNHKDRHPYGIFGETVSEVLYYREKENKLDFKDKVIYNGILIFDKNHFEIFDIPNKNEKSDN